MTYGQGKAFRYNFGVIRYPVIAASGAIAAVDTASRGFRARTHQSATAQANTLDRAENQLAGNLGENIADLGAAEADGTFKISVINFEQGAVDAPGESIGNNELFPGITEATGSKDNFAMEIR